VEFDLREVGAPPSLLDFIALIVVGFGWLLYWRLLKRGILTRAFCVWFPTAMLGLLTLVMWLSDFIDSSSFAGSVLEFVALVIAAMNLPGFILVWLPGAIVVDYLPVPARLPVAGGLFWMSWYFVLRFLRWRITLERPIALNLSE